MKELKKMSYATGLRPRYPWLLLRGTIKTNLFFQSAFSPEDAAREDGDRVLQIHPFLSLTKPFLCLVIRYKTPHRSQKTSLGAFYCQGTSSSFGSCSQQFLSNLGLISAYNCFCVVFPLWGWIAIWAVRGNPMCCSLGLSLGASCGPCCRTSRSAGSILLAQHTKERDNKNHCHN